MHLLKNIFLQSAFLKYCIIYAEKEYSLIQNQEYQTITKKYQVNCKGISYKSSGKSVIPFEISSLVGAPHLGHLALRIYA